MGERLKLDGRCHVWAAEGTVLRLIFTAAPLFLQHDRGPAACESMNAKILPITDAERTQCLSW